MGTMHLLTVLFGSGFMHLLDGSNQFKTDKYCCHHRSCWSPVRERQGELVRIFATIQDSQNSADKKKKILTEHLEVTKGQFTLASSTAGWRRSLPHENFKAVF